MDITESNGLAQDLASVGDWPFRIRKEALSHVEVHLKHKKIVL